MPLEIWPVTAAILKFKMAAFSLKAYTDRCQFSLLFSSKVSKAKVLMLNLLKIYFNAFQP